VQPDTGEQTVLTVDHKIKAGVDPQDYIVTMTSELDSTNVSLTFTRGKTQAKGKTLTNGTISSSTATLVIPCNIRCLRMIDAAYMTVHETRVLLRHHYGNIQ
jgi:hypothetical protein